MRFHPGSGALRPMCYQLPFFHPPHPKLWCVPDGVSDLRFVFRGKPLPHNGCPMSFSLGLATGDLLVGFGCSSHSIGFSKWASEPLVSETEAKPSSGAVFEKHSALKKTKQIADVGRCFVSFRPLGGRAVFWSQDLGQGVFEARQALEENSQECRVLAAIGAKT